MAESKNRKRRTEAEKAQDALDVTSRKLGRAKERRDRLKKEWDAAQSEYEALAAQHEYQAAHPALKKAD